MSRTIWARHSGATLAARMSATAACVYVLLLLPSFVFSAPGPIVTISVTNADVREVLAQMASQAGVKIVPDPSVTGQVTITLKRVPLRDALRKVLAPLGFEANKV